MLAIISDTHGNLVALEAALADARKLGVNKFICLGDVASFGPEPKETLDLVKTLDCPIILGNTDDVLLNPENRKIPRYTDDTPKILDIENWSTKQLKKEDKAFIKTWPMTHDFSIDGVEVLAFHASPNNYRDIIIPSTDGEQIGKYFEGFSADLFIHGHTHTQYVRKCKESRILNPGSVGQPYVIEGSSPYNPTFAEYAILQVENSQANISFRRVVYSLEDLKSSVARSSMPHKDWWLKNWQQA